MTLIAAFVSLSKLAPHIGHKCQRSDSFFFALYLHAEQSWLV